MISGKSPAGHAACLQAILQGNSWSPHKVFLIAHKNLLCEYESKALFGRRSGATRTVLRLALPVLQGDRRGGGVGGLRADAQEDSRAGLS